MREGGREGIILRLNSTPPFVSHQSTEVHEIEFCFKQTVFFIVSLPPPLLTCKSTTCACTKVIC